MRLVEKRKPVLKIRMVLFILLILSYSLTSSDNGETSSSVLKYISLTLCIIHSGLLFYTKKREILLKKEYRRLFIFVAVVVIYSLVKSLIASHFSFRTIQELIFLFCPMIYGYFVINTWRKEEIDTAFKFGLIVSFICYVFSLRMSFQDIFRALLNSSFGNSYSELESFTYCGLAIAFCLYFCYYNRNKVFTILSFLFVIMTFKRLFVLIAIGLLILSNLKMREEEISKKWVNITISTLFLFAIAYYAVMQPDIVSLIENRFGLDISKLTMTRSDRMRWLMSSSYTSYGYGSSTEYMYDHFYGALEMDASKIIIELGYIPLFAFFVSYVKYAKKNLYVFFFMFLMMVNLIMSSGLTGSFAWCVIFIAISMISVYPEERKWKGK